MSNEFQIDRPDLTGLTLYFVQFDAETTDQAWNGSAYATYTSTRDTWDIALTEVSGTGLFRGSIAGTARYVRLSVYLQAGGSPSFANDVKILDARYYWDGTLLVEQGSVVSVGSLGAQAKLDVNAEADTALADYDGPTNAEMEARTLAAASYATASALGTTDGKVDDILTDTGTTLPGVLTTIAGYIDTEIASIITTLGTPSVTIADDIAGIEAGSGPTVEEIRAEMDSNSTQLAAIVLDTGTTLPGILGTPSVTLADDIAAIEAGSGPTVEEIRAEIDSNSTQLAAIVTDTNELQTDWADGGRLDLILDARSSQTSVDDVPNNSEFTARTLATADYGTSANQNTLLGRLTSARAGFLDNLNVSGLVASASSLAQVVSPLAGITSLANWLRAGFRKGNNDSTAISEINADNGTGTGTFDPTADSTEALRDRGDAAYLTATGFAVAGDIPSASENADAVWDEPKAGHTTANTYGAFVDQKISDVEGGTGGGTTANFDNTKIVQTRVLKIGSRHDNVYRAHLKARYVVGELTPFWIDMSRFTGPDPIYDVEDATASDESLTITSTGVNRDLVVVWLNTTGVAPGEYTVNVEVHPHPGETVIVEAIVVVVASIV